MTKLVSILMPLYNAEKWLAQTIESVLAQTYFNWELIIVDDGSTDNSYEDAQCFAKKDSRIKVYKQKNKGACAARNKAFEKGADYVFLLNQDAWVEVNTIERLIKISNQNKDYFILSPLHVEPGKNRLDGNYLNYLARSKENNLLSDFILDNPLKKVYPVEFVNAAAWLLTKECYEKVGLFDSLFYHYGEDRNYSQRVKYHNGKIGIVPNVNAFHDRDTYNSRSSSLQSNRFLRKILIEVADINNAEWKYLYFKLVSHNFLYGLLVLFINRRTSFQLISSSFLGLGIYKRIFESRVKNKNVYNEIS